VLNRREAAVRVVLMAAEIGTASAKLPSELVFRTDTFVDKPDVGAKKIGGASVVNQNILPKPIYLATFQRKNSRSKSLI
jgi:hypothetical protein